MITVDELKNFFQVNEDQDLAAIFGKSPAAISKWRSLGVPAIAERRAYEIMQQMGIVREQPAPKYTVDVVELPPGLAKENVEKYLKLPRSVQAMMARIFDNMQNMTEEEQWAYITDRLAKYQKNEGD